jgi:DNA-binding NtrC family response regulator
MGRVLIAEDEEGIRAFLAEALERDGHDVVAVPDGEAAVAALREGTFELVVTDLRMPKADGMTVVRAARLEQPDVEVIVLTAFGDVRSAVEAMKLGAYEYLEKPIESPAAIRALVAGALERRGQLVAGAAPVAAAETAGPLVSRSPKMRAVEQSIAKVARTGTTVLLQGESGSGKEITARAIHEASPRAGQPFLAINCAVLSEALIESELFGHEKGAFTGAHVQRRGRLELADGGTFFLDEVAELHPSLQAKLLRVLEERSFERVGSATPIAIDVRFIAATHKDLRALVREGKFREDIYHRLAVFPIVLPPLRERREDIVPLAERLLRALHAEGASRFLPLSPEVRAHLEAAPWPGNVRELRNVLERGVILADGAPLRVEHLPYDADQEVAAQRSSGATLEELEKAAIVSALSAVQGNRKDAARRLGIGLRTLYEKIKRYGLR